MRTKPSNVENSQQFSRFSLTFILVVRHLESLLSLIMILQSVLQLLASKRLLLENLLKIRQNIDDFLQKKISNNSVTSDVRQAEAHDFSSFRKLCVLVLDNIKTF